MIQEVDLLYKITETISSNLNLSDVLKHIIEIVYTVTKCDSCLIYLFDKQNNELVLTASKNPHSKILGKIKLKLGEGITGVVAKEKKYIAISKDASNDTRFKFFHNLPEDKYQAFLSVPIFNKNEVIGVINVQHKKINNYTKGIIKLISTIANQVGGAIENARLYQETEKKAKQIETLSKLSETIISSKYLEEILHLIVCMTAEMMNSKICSIMLLDEEKKELIIKATQSLSEEYRKKPNIKLNKSISGKAVLERKPISVFDVKKEKDYNFPEIAIKEGLYSLLCTPMMIKDKIIGVINVYTSQEHKFLPDEIKIFQTVANQAAVAIENTKLMEESLAAKKALESRKLIERAKGILMKEYNLLEEDAYKIIHKKSMDSGKPMKEIAEAIITASEIKNKI